MSVREFDFNRVGKRMPYIVPEGFFERLEAQPVPSPVKRRRRLAPLARFAASVAVAAVLAGAVYFITTPAHRSAAPARAVTSDAVIEAFDNLSADDQAFLMDLYQEDIFLNTQKYNYDSQKNF